MKNEPNYDSFTLFIDLIDGRTYGRVYRWVNGWVGGWVDGSMDRLIIDYWSTD